MPPTAEGSHVDRGSAYNLSFTAASLRPELARVIAECYLELGDWDAAKERVLATNALQARNPASAVRMERELRRRLMRLTGAQLAILAQAPADERAAMVWLSALKHIPFAFDFAAEVLREKLATRDPVLRPSDYENYVEQKALAHPEIVALKATSGRKVRQVLLLMLLEASLLTKGMGLGSVHRPILSRDVTCAITSDNPMWLAGFLVPDREIKTV